ncbi:MAG: hypothetical protein AAFY20_07570 [Cyanobacteria bacterium J06639_14]
MLRHNWPRNATQRQLAKRLCKLGLFSGLMLVTVLLSQWLSQPVAWAYALPQNLPELAFRESIYLVLALFAGSILVVESRRLSTFILGLLLMIIVFGAIAQFGHPQTLIPVAMGLGLSIVLVGSWWWGYRQGYIQALYTTIIGRQQNDPLFSQVIQSYEVQHSETESSAGFLRTLNYRARAIRYCRLMGESEVKTLYTLIKSQIQQDWQQAQAAHHTDQLTQQRAQIQALLAKVDYLCEHPRPATPSTSTPLYSQGPLGGPLEDFREKNY